MVGRHALGRGALALAAACALAIVVLLARAPDRGRRARAAPPARPLWADEVDDLGGGGLASEDFASPQWGAPATTDDGGGGNSALESQPLRARLSLVEHVDAARRGDALPPPAPHHAEQPPPPPPQAPAQPWAAAPPSVSSSARALLAACGASAAVLERARAAGADGRSWTAVRPRARARV